MKSAAWLIAGALLAAQLPAQEIKWNFDKLAAKASDSVEVNLSGRMLSLATKFLSEDDQDEAKVKKLIGGLKGIYVRTFEFKNRGDYTQADLEPFRAPLRSPDWERIVGVHSSEDGENVEIYIKSESKGVGGLAIVATDPKEITLVNIVGAIDLDSLSKLGGHLGIPEVELEKKK